MNTQKKLNMLQKVLPPSIFLTLTLLLSISFTVPTGYPGVTRAEPSGSGYGKLEGTVTDDNTGDPVASASILLYKTQCLSASGRSGPDGSFFFPGIPAGTYTLEVSKTGYKPVRDKVVITSGNTTRCDITLPVIRSDEEQSLVEREKKIMPAMECRGVHQSAKSDGNGYLGGIMAGSFLEASVPEFNTESYDRIYENHFKEVIHDPLSTFSIDVDRASYSNVRRFLSNNTLPYKDAVRIEEMINYFDYDYAQPVNGEPFSVTFEGGPCYWNNDHRLILIGIQGRTVKTAEIPPANLVFLIDVSGSMDSPGKLPLLKQAFKILVQQLRPVDRVAMVVYAGAAGCVLESTPGDHQEKILMALDNLEAGGSTAGGEGIRLAYQIAKMNYLPGGNNRVILATDGDFNIGASSDAEMVRLIEEKRQDGVFLSILGFGMGNYKDSKMEKISNAGNGNYAYVDNIMEAKKVFGTELWGTLFTIAKDVKIQVEFNPEKVKAYRLIGYENRILNKEDFNNDRKDAGDIGSGHSVTALYEIIPAGSPDPVAQVDPLEYQKVNITGGSNLMTVKLRFKEPDDTVSKLIVHRLGEQEAMKDTRSDNIKFAAAVAAFGMVLRESENRGAASFDQALLLANESMGADRYGYRRDFIRLVETAKLLTR